MKSRQSDRLFRQAQEVLVGGVNSPVRAFHAVGGTPRFITRARGPLIWDADGRRYIDYCMSWGALPLGHAPRPVVSALTRAIRKGTSFGAPTPAELELAQRIKDAFPSIARLRFVNSGTEAVLSAVRLARAATQRETLVKFAGGYHGHVDSLLVRSGSGALTLAMPDSAGVPMVLAQRTRVLRYNDVEALRELFQREGHSIAAVILEPVAANMGVVPAREGYLEELRTITLQYGALLIFDEVITGFRVTYGGVQTLLNIAPDLTCLGKIIGGGFPVGAYGGRKDLMDWIAPVGPVYQAGTLSGNPVAMAAGLTTLRLLKSKGVYKKLEALTTRLTEGLDRAAREAGLSVRINRVGSMFTLFFTDAPVVDLVSVQRADPKRYAAFFHALLERGVYFPPSPFEACFVSLAHAPGVIRKTLSASERAFQKVAAHG